MIHHDPIYAFTRKINLDPIAMIIINTPEFFRLRGIKQAGITGLFTQRTYTRDEHSIGVYMLLRYLGAPIEQCIGGLLHDIYHTNFSHTTDELFSGESQESFHEKNKFNFFERCCKNISRILTISFPKMRTYQFLEGKNMTITKDKLFGADMIDYFLRDGFYEKVFSYTFINDVVSKLRIQDGRIIITDKIMAEQIFRKTILINDNFYMSPFSRGQYKVFTQLLKMALIHHIVTVEELIYGTQTDMAMYCHMKRHCTPEMRKLIDLLESPTQYSFTPLKDSYSFSKGIVRKMRFLNPVCMISPKQCRTTTQLFSDAEEFLLVKQLEYAKQEELFIK